MKTINLREYYTEIYKDDCFVEVTNEVAAALAEDKRRQKNYAQYIRDNKAFYSLDIGDEIETDAVEKPEQPDEIFEQRELEQTIAKAFAHLTETQQKRLYERIVMKKSYVDMAAAEGVDVSSVRKVTERALRNLKKYLNFF